MRRKICATKNQKIVQDGFAALLRACKSREDGRHTDGPSSRPARAQTNRVAAPSLSRPTLYHRLPGPHECGRGGSADARRLGLQRQCGWPRSRDVFHRIRGARNPRRVDCRTLERTPLDRPHYDFLGDDNRAAAVYPLSFLIGSPLAGLLLGITWLGLRGWRWLFILEGIPAVVFGVITLFYLTDWPRTASWLRPDERDWINDELEREKQE